MTSTRRFTLLAVLGLASLSACGDPEPGSAASVPMSSEVPDSAEAAHCSNVSQGEAPYPCSIRTYACLEYDKPDCDTVQYLQGCTCVRQSAVGTWRTGGCCTQDMCEDDPDVQCTPNS
jgi:hypothetical protein